LQSIPPDEIGFAPGQEPGEDDEPAVARLARDMRRKGARGLLLVTHDDDAPPYRLVTGGLQLAAARRLRLKSIQALVLAPRREYAAELRVIERLHGGTWEPFELADTLRALGTRCGLTQTHTGQAIGKSRDFVAGILAISNIQPEVRHWLGQNPQGKRLTVRHLRYVGRAAAAEQMAIAQRIISENLSTKQLETLNPQAFAPVRRGVRVREPLPARDQQAVPYSEKYWRRFLRRTATDLRRLERQESRERTRLEMGIEAARQRLAALKTEARARRQELLRRQKLAERNLARFR